MITKKKIDDAQLYIDEQKQLASYLHGKEKKRVKHYIYLLIKRLKKKRSKLQERQSFTFEEWINGKKKLV